MGDAHANLFIVMVLGEENHPYYHVYIRAFIDGIIRENYQIPELGLFKTIPKIAQTHRAHTNGYYTGGWTLTITTI